jgi:hypothetical protein
MEEKTGKCCICGKKYKGRGHIAWPFEQNLDDDNNSNNMCCDVCDEEVVMPAVRAIVKFYNTY